VPWTQPGTGLPSWSPAHSVLFLSVQLLLPLRILLPLAVAVSGPDAERNRSFAVVFVVLALMAVGQYFTLAEGWTDSRYTYQSFLLLIGFAIIMIELARESLRLAPCGAALGLSQPSPQVNNGDSWRRRTAALLAV